MPRRPLPFDILKRAKSAAVPKIKIKKWEHRSNLGKKEKNNRKVNIGGSNPELATANTKPSDLVIDGRHGQAYGRIIILATTKKS